MATRIGNWQLDSVSGGRFKLDGGAMFGVVPKPLWEKKIPSDARNGIPMASHCILARNGEHTILIESGYGSKSTDKDKEIFGMEDGDPLLDSLHALGIAPEDITAVMLTHLHFDHAGGATRLDAQGRPVPSFPNATYFIGKKEWEVATQDIPELRGSYPVDNFHPLAHHRVLRLVEDGEKIIRDVTMMSTPGHTMGHMSIVLQSGDQTAIYLGDVCPTTAHIQSLWCMAYDLYPMTIRRTKPDVLGKAADEGWLAIWGHDPRIAAGYLQRDHDKEFLITESFDNL